MLKFDYLVYIILFLIAVALFFHYRERISKKIIMTESYTDVDSVNEGQLSKYDISYNDMLQSYDEISKSYTNMKTQNNKLEPGSLANPSSYDQNFNILRKKYDKLSGEVKEKREAIAANVELVSKRYDEITSTYTSQSEKSYVRNEINKLKDTKVGDFKEGTTADKLKAELNKQVADTSADNIIKKTGAEFNVDLNMDSSGNHLNELIKPIYNDGFNTAKTTILKMANGSPELLTEKVNTEIGIRKRTLPNDDLSTNNGVVVRIYNNLKPPRDKLKEYVIPSINYYTASANDGIFNSSKGSSSNPRFLEFITMIRIPNKTTNITLSLFTGTSSSLFINGTEVIKMNAALSGTERLTDVIQVTSGEKIPIKIVVNEGDSSQESYVVLKWKKGTETNFEIISSNSYFMPKLSIYGS